REGDGGDPDRDVDPEHRSPADAADQQGAQHGPGRGGDPDCRSPHTARPSPDPHTRPAQARSRRAVNTLTIIDSATRLSIEPPTACRPWKAISHPTLGARPHSRELRENSDSPSWKIRLRPKRSAISQDSTR